MPSPISSRITLKKNRIRMFFTSLEKKGEKKEEFQPIEEQILSEGMIYRQMRLPVGNVSPEFESYVNKKVKENFLKPKIREIKNGSNEDLKSIVNLYNKAWLTSQTPFRRLSLTALKKIAEDPDTVILIAKVYNVDSGFVILDFEGEQNEIGVIAGLGILPKFQHRKLGTALGLAAWNYFKNQGVKELRCEVYIENKVSYSFIKALGFEEFDSIAYKGEDFRVDLEE
jgi:ribosomal protein S18 acetylase RimI-like enzyme